ncbi:hypothetical protein [Kordia jejudonensis]|uniref:hypothetical protein n=1 Tax=Kordia jejudonensis TaxID=1348245 RepID=UPI0006290026|nr:hypothetical protein [Kordia jejudonensis]
MERVEHRIYFEKNEIKPNVLIEPIRDKIDIFNRMHKLYEGTSVCAKKDIKKELEMLDTEIMNDIDDEYEDRLTIGAIKKDASPVKPKKQNKTTKLSNDESILSKLVALGSTKNIGLSTFTELGLQTSLGWNTIIGKYQIKRTSVMAYKYDIHVSAK